jgi:hypothetical protein
MTLSINEWRAQAEFWAPTEKCSGLIASIGLCRAVKHLSVCAGERFEASPQHPSERTSSRPTAGDRDGSALGLREKTRRPF